jgi:hypothetical protein
MSLRMTLRAPLLLMLLAVTAIPGEVRPFDSAVINLDLNVSDIVANVAGYIPVGLVFAGTGSVQALIVAALVSTLAETVQLFTINRHPSSIDVVSNVTGAAIGLFLVKRWRVPPALKLDRRRGSIALALAAVIFGLGIWNTSLERTNSRGLLSMGTLEAHWQFDETNGVVVSDSSGNGLHGILKEGAALVSGWKGNAVKLNGYDYVDFGNPLPLRLTGSMTATAWINSESFPGDDAVIVANRDGRPSGAQGPGTNTGFQLDTSLDMGFRAAGFGLVDTSGIRVFRAGATRLSLRTWYHVAGVYDASTRSIDVYLNGQLDNGLMRGQVPGCQASPNRNVSIGRLPDSPGYEFAGLIDEVRIYSRALTAEEIRSDMNGMLPNSGLERTNRRSESLQTVDDSCRRTARLGRLAMPVFTAGFGLLVGAAFAGFWQPQRYVLQRIACLVVSLVAGLLFLFSSASTLPMDFFWMIPLLSLAGGASVAISLINPKTPPGSRLN